MIALRNLCTNTAMNILRRDKYDAATRAVAADGGPYKVKKIPECPVFTILETGGKERKQPAGTGKNGNNRAIPGRKRKEPEKAAKSLVRDQKAAGERADRQPSGLFADRRKEGERINRNKPGRRPKAFWRRLRLRPEGESRHFDSPGHCKSMLPGFCFSCGFSAFFRFAIFRVAAVREGTEFRFRKCHFRNFPYISGFFRF